MIHASFLQIKSLVAERTGRDFGFKHLTREHVAGNEVIKGHLRVLFTSSSSTYQAFNGEEWLTVEKYHDFNSFNFTDGPWVKAFEKWFMDSAQIILDQHDAEVEKHKNKYLKLHDFWGVKDAE